MPICELEASTSCQLSRLVEVLSRVNALTDVIIPVAGIGATVVLGFFALRASNAANRVASTSVELSRQNVELVLREERRRYASAVLGYYERRHEDLSNGRHANMPHWVDSVRAVGREIGQPNSEELLQWVLDSIDHTFEGPPYHAHLNALWLREEVQLIVGAWVHDPVRFDPEPWRRYDERPSNA